LNKRKFVSEENFSGEENEEEEHSFGVTVQTDKIQTPFDNRNSKNSSFDNNKSSGRVSK